MNDERHTYTASTVKRGRFTDKPYVPVVVHAYEGPACAVPIRRTQQVRPFAFATRKEAVACAQKHIDTNYKFAPIPTPDLFAVVATLEAAHEPKDLTFAQAMLAEWGISHEEAAAELLSREAHHG